MVIKSKDIAKIAGVSRPVVSAVLNGRNNCRVSMEKRKQILQIAKEHHYYPDKAALKLAGKPTKTIGVILDSFYGIGSVTMQELSCLLFMKGYCMQSIMFESAPQAYQAISNFCASGVDGLIFPNYILEKLRHENLPVPAVIHGLEVITDYAYGMELATRHLIEHGHRKIAYNRGLLLHGNKLKFEGYRKALEDAGLETFQVDLKNYDALKKATRNGITAFACSGDPLARKCIDMLNHMGTRVPEDCAVTGFDGLSHTGAFTTVVDPVADSARITMDLLMDKIARQDMSISSNSIKVKPYLHIGNSCGCPWQPVDFYTYHYDKKNDINQIK